MARKTRAKRPTQLLDAGHMQEILQEMKSEKAAAPRLSKKQSKALHKNFLQVEKPVVTVSAKRLENQYEALAQELAAEGEKNAAPGEVQFACDIYSRDGEWLASLPNQDMAAMYAAIINARLAGGAYIYVPGSRSWLGEAPEMHKELARLADMAKELGRTWGIYDVADSMCMLLAVCREEAHGKAISNIIREQNGRAHAVQPLIYHADIQRAFVYKFFIRFRYVLDLDARALFHAGYIDSSQDIWQEMQELLLPDATQGGLKKLAKHYVQNANDDVSQSSLQIMLNIMAYRRLYEACYNPHAQMADKLAGSADIYCYHVVARGWQRSRKKWAQRPSGLQRSSGLAGQGCSCINCSSSVSKGFPKRSSKGFAAAGRGSFG